MIAEKIALNFDVSSALASLEGLMKRYPPVELYPGYGGWSITSADGSHESGWNKQAISMSDTGEYDLESTYRNFSNMKMAKDSEHTVPTVFMTPPVESLIHQLKRLNLNPCRARLHRLSPQRSLYWHLDTPPQFYSVRLHIPLLTNEACYFETPEGREHFSADGSGYFVHVNRRHRAVNEGTNERLHIVVSVIDSHGVTKFHRRPENA